MAFRHFAPPLLLSALLVHGFVGASLPAAEPAAASNPVFEALLSEGVASSDGEHYRLPKPTLSLGADAAAQQQAVQSIADTRRTVAVLTRKSVVAPFVLEVHTLDNAAGKPSTARGIDLWFVAYGRLDKITEDGVLDFLRDANRKESSKTEDEKGGGFLSEEDIARRKLRAANADPKRERYFYNSFELFDRVEIQGTRRAVVTPGEHSILIAIQFDPRFDGDAEHPNQWRPLKRDELGKLVAGEPQPYSHTGSYLHIVQLNEPADALFIEYHLVFDEPKDWFKGANLVRSKVPVLIEDLVRKARRKLAKTLGDAAVTE